MAHNVPLDGFGTFVNKEFGSILRAVSLGLSYRRAQT